jgi:hypothetical protein
MSNQKVNAAGRLSAAGAAGLLVDAVQELSAVKDLNAVVEIVKKAARQITQADGATFVLRDGDQCHYVDEDAIGPLWKGRRFPMEICISGWVMQNRQAAIIPDIFTDERIPQDAYRPTFVRSLAVVPIRSLDPIGAIGIYWRERNSPTPEAVRLLQSLADSTALAIEHLNARNEISEIRYSADLMKGEIDALRKDVNLRKPLETIRMCFITNRIEVDGEWLSFEAFLQKRYGLEVTHGLCPEGMQRLQADAPVENAANANGDGVLVGS